MAASALDTYNYLICTDDQFLDCLSVLPTSSDGFYLRFVDGSDGTQVLLASEMPLEVNRLYRLFVLGGSDRLGNSISGTLVTNIVVPKIAAFRQGVNGYLGTADTHLRQDRPDISFPVNVQVLVDSLNPVSHGLLRFENIIGGGTGQIPFGAAISSATLSLRTVNATRDGELVEFHRMLQPWRDTDTWNTPWGNGLKADDVIAAAAVAAEINPATNSMTLDFDVTSSVQAWVNGQLNYGWFLTNTMDDGYQFASSESATIDYRPLLTVDYEFGQPAPVALVVLPPTNQIVVDQGQPFAMVYGVAGPNLQLQWFKDNGGLPGETNAALSRSAATLADTGDYFLRVTNDYPSATNSPVIQVTVVADTTPPAVVSAVATGTTNLTRLTLQFSEPLAAAGPGNVEHYQLSPNIPITGVTVLNSTTVELELTAPFGQRYYLTLDGALQDVHGNSVSPNYLEVTTELVLVDWQDDWKLDASDTDLMATFADPGFDDSAWSSGPGLLGTEADPLPGGLTIRTPVAATGYTSYYRKQVSWPYATATLDPAVEIAVVHAVDDGVVFHFNGAEAFRFKMPTGTVTHATFADTAGFDTDAVAATNTLPPDVLAFGTTTIAADLHAINTTSSDNVFGARLLAVLPPKTPVRFISGPTTNVLVVAQGQPFGIEFEVAGFSRNTSGFTMAESFRAPRRRRTR